MGITLVVLTLLQLLAVLALWDWNAEPYRQLVVERLIKESPMALVGLLFMYVAGRLDQDNGWRRSPLLWTVCVLSGLMAVLLTSALPIVFGGDRLMQEQTDQQIAAKLGQLEMARQQSKSPEVIQQLLSVNRIPRRLSCLGVSSLRSILDARSLSSSMIAV